MVGVGLLPPQMSLVGGIPTTMPAPVSGGTCTIRLRLLPSGAQDRKLRRIATYFAKLWNEVNFVRRKQFFEGKHVDLRSTYKEFYDKYKSVLGVNAQQLLNMNDEAWKSFFTLLKQGIKASPPGYWKDRLLSKRELRVVGIKELIRYTASYVTLFSKS